MKFWKYTWLMLTMTISLFGLSACQDDDDYSLDKFAIEIMTVVPDGSTYYLRRDNGEKLWPFATNCPGYNFSKTRAQVNYTMLSDSIPGFSHGIKINWIENILTKKISPYLAAENDSVYGTDPVEMLAMAIGDGYLDVRFAANFGNTGVKHLISLIPTQADNSDPYTLEFRHQAYGDGALYAAEGLVSFDLSSLPDTKGETVDLTIKVKTFDGEKSYKLAYNSDPACMYSEPDEIISSDDLSKNIH